MAGDILIRFTGDASGLASFYAGVARQTDAFVSGLAKTYRNEFSNIIGNPQVGSGIKSFFTLNDLGKLTKVGTEVRGITTEFDQLNDVIKLTATSGIKLRNGTFLPVAQTTAFRGSVKALTDELLVQDELLQKRSGVSTKFFSGKAVIDADVEQAKAEAAAIQAEIETKSSNLAQLRRDREENNAAIRAQRAQITKFGLTTGDEESVSANERLQALLANRSAIQKEINLGVKDLTKSQEAYDASLADPRITEAPAKLKTIATEAVAARAQIDNALKKSYAATEAIKTSAPYAPPQGYQQLPPELKKILTRGGLAQSAEGLYAQNATFNAPSLDLVRNLTQQSGTFYKTLDDGRKILTRWSAEVDGTGRVITRFGGNLSGISKVGQQIVRDFQKVVEWTVATTVVFGGLATAIQGLGLIKDLDADLTRFSVTAGLSAQQTKEFYNQIVQVAQITATPLEELVKSADDLALAVRKPGESVQQLTSDVLALATAVGVYTNLTGSDTVSATDQLVAIMKQLGVTAEGTVGILTKITAVAGGQSSAIADITKGLAVMAEAGKEANLSVDQQIATIKVLSQVTSKSPAEIATAFKNLVGALENPAAIKALKSYNIQLISDGRSIIQIYSDIAQKIREGVIPQNDVSGLLRAISGGPRRAPDAAALLANISSVQEETVVSTKATNEAFLANAKVLDTLNAKFTQFQNTLKDKTFRQFGEVLKDVATTGITALTNLLRVVGNIPSGFITLGVEVGALFLLFKGLSALLTRLGLDFILTGQAQQKLTAATVADIAAQRGEAEALSLRARAGQLLGSAKLSGRQLGAFGAGAALGGATALISGASPLQALGAAAQGGGLALLSLPSPDPYTKVAGAVALLGGTFLTMAQDSHKAEDATRENAGATLDAYNSYKQTADTIAKLNNSQDDLITQMDQSGQSMETLGELQRQYVDNTIAMTQAQNDLNGALKALHDVNPEFATLVQNVNAGIRPASELTAQLQQLQKLVLQNNFPNIALPNENGRSSFTGNAPFVDPNLSNPLTTITNNNGVTKDFDIRGLKEDAQAVLKLFNQDGTAITATFAATTENIEAIRTALGSIDDTKLRTAALKTLEDWVATKNAVESAIAAVNLYQAELQASQPFFTPEDYDSIQKGIKAMQQLIILKNAGKIDEGSFNNLFDKYQKIIGDALHNNTGISTGVFKDFSEEYARATGELKGVVEGSDEWKNKLNEVALKLFGMPNLFGKIRGAIAQVSDATAQFSEDIDKAAASAQKGLADRSYNLHLQVTGGEDTTDSLQKIEATRNLINQVQNSLQQGVNLGGDSFIAGIDELKDSLKHIPGLEDAASLSTADFIAKIFDMAANGKLTAAQINQLTQAIEDYIKAASVIGDIKASIPGIEGNSKQEVLSSLQQARKDLVGQIKEGGPAQLKLDLVGVDQAISDVNALKDTLPGISTLLNQASVSSAKFGQDLSNSIKSVRDEILSDLASKSSDAFQKFLSGDISAAQLKKIQNGLNNLRGSVINLSNAFANAAQAGGQSFAESLSEVEARLTHIPGLEDATSLSASQLVKRMFDLAQAYNLNGKGIDLLGGKMNDLIKAMAAVDRARAYIHVGAEVDLRGLIAMYKALQQIPVVNAQTGFVTGTTSSHRFDDIIAQLEAAQKTFNSFGSGVNNIFKTYGGTGSFGTTSGSGSKSGGSSGSSTKPGFDTSTLDLPDEIANATDRDALIQEAIRRARALQSKIPGATKDARNDIVELLKGTQRILEVRGVKDDYLRKALEELADVEKKRLEFDTKADTIRRIRVGSGSFAALANVPLNSQTGVSVGGPEGPITVNLNINGQILTPAQFSALADQIAAAIKKQIGA